ncbi:hypothetical protein BIPXVNHO_CDS0065 [Staphylococcus phage PG-2021_27]|nr:hypothetical protein Alsa2_CDS0089 [Staphylococcus phage Alsa_2]
MEIKIKEKLNFQELISFIYENNIKDARYLPNDFDTFGNTVWVRNYGLEFSDDSYFTKNDTWTVERKVELTKDIKLPTILVNDGKCFLPYYNITIKDLEKRFTSHVYGIETIHLINDDSTHTLIYKDGELVE